MPRYKLRTLLILLAVIPPLIGGLVHYRRWRDKRLWLTLEAAKRERDESLVTWRRTYELVSNGQVPAGEEIAIQQQYYVARQDVEMALVAIRTRYGGTDADLKRALLNRPPTK